MTNPDVPVPTRDDRPEKSVLIFPDYSLNPYLTLLMGSLVAHGMNVRFADYHTALRWRTIWTAPPVIHLQWERPWLVHARWGVSVLRSVRLITALAALRLSGRRVVWTVHNLADHDRRHPRTERFFQLLLARLAHGVIVHFPSAVEIVERELHVRRGHTHVAPIGSYLSAYPPQLAKATARQGLHIGEDEVVFLAFGAVRAYKRLPTLIDAFCGLDEPGVRLVIAGKPGSEGEGRAVEEAADQDQRISLMLRYIEPDELSLLLSAADVFVLPSVDQLTSSSTTLALEFGLRVVASDQPHARYLNQQDRFAFFDSSDVGSLREALARSARKGPPADAQAAPMELTWDPAAIAHLEAYGLA